MKRARALGLGSRAGPGGDTDSVSPDPAGAARIIPWLIPDGDPLADSTAAAAYLTGFSTGIAPRPDILLDQWADENVVLVEGETNEPGPWRTARTPYLREPMRLLSVGSPVSEMTVMKGAQMGWTQMVKCWIGYTIALDPSPTLFYLPTRELAAQTSRLRIDPLFDSTPALRELVSRSRSRDNRNTTFEKVFLGGRLMMRGANSANAFRNLSARRLILDDLDGWPGEVGTEGDPVSLIRKRATTYPNRVMVKISTPTIRDISRIERDYLLSDQRRWFMPCPHCGHMDFLTWSGFGDFVAKRDPGHHHIVWPEDQPEAAAMACGRCGEWTAERMKPWMFERAEWRATAPGPGRHPGFHLPGLCTPYGWGAWGDSAKEFQSARGNPILLRSIVNTVLAETYEDHGVGGVAAEILDRLEVYPAEVPDGVGVLVASVDTQDEWLEVAVKGFGAGEESWLIDHRILEGDPAKADVWKLLDAIRLQTYAHASGQRLRISVMAIDSGGHRTEHVYRYVKDRAGKQVYAVRGGNLTHRPIVGQPTRKNAYRIPLYTLCTDTAKELVYSRMQIPPPEPGAAAPGYMHFPAAIVDGEYAEQLTAEKGRYKWQRGKGYVRIWEKKTGVRNEKLDLEVYALAALYIRASKDRNLIAGLARRAKLLSRRLAGPDGAPGPAGAAPAVPAPVAEAAPETPASAAAPAVPRRRRPGAPAWPRRSGWVKNW